MQKIEINREPVELYKVLKFEGLAESGGHAKAVIDAGQVAVNGVVEMRKRCKLKAGDTIAFDGSEFELIMLSE